MNINARSLLFGAQKAAGLMKSRGGGAIVALSSMGSSRVLPDYAVVGASKAAIESLVRYLGVELAPHRIRVNAVSPGIVETDALSHFPIFQENESHLVSEVRKYTPAGRLCSPADVAHVVEFLCSEEAQMICGQTIVLDGGFSLLVR
jgi:enoyl-[acyl-carrier protein] reductase III